MSSSWCGFSKQYFMSLLIFLEKPPTNTPKGTFSAMIKNSLRGRRLFEDIMDHSDRRLRTTQRTRTPTSWPKIKPTIYRGFLRFAQSHHG